MHDTDRTSREMEFGTELQELQPEQFELYEGGEMGGSEMGFGEMPESGYGEFQEGELHELPLQESEEMEFAAELLEVNTEEELDRFLGKLIKKVGGVVGKIARSPIGKMVGGYLKPLAKAALPMAGKALGGFFGGPLGAMVGGKLASMAGQAFGLELEGLSSEDREFEVARRFVRFASTATSKALTSPPQLPPHVAVRKAVATAARQHAPGLLRMYARNLPRRGPELPSYPSGAYQDYSGSTYSDGARNRGTWIRRGHRIIILGL